MYSPDEKNNPFPQRLGETGSSPSVGTLSTDLPTHVKLARDMARQIQEMPIELQAETVHVIMTTIRDVLYNSTENAERDYDMRRKVYNQFLELNFPELTPKTTR